MNTASLIGQVTATVGSWPTLEQASLIVRAFFARNGQALEDLGGYVRRGVRLGIGTDSFPHNMLEEMRLAAILARVVTSDVTSVSTAEVFHAATIGGADLVGRSDLGRLSVGATADLVLVDVSHPSMMPVRDPLRSLIYTAAGARDSRCLCRWATCGRRR